MTIEVVPYGPDWPLLFEAERALLERVLASWLDGGIHHIGSTAIPGLAAKPVIDMMAGVRDLEQARAAFEPLAEHGYEYTPHRPRTHRFGKAQTHGLHLTEVGTDLWLERLAFRDALRSDPELAAEYQELKLRLAPNTAQTSAPTRSPSDRSSPPCSREWESRCPRRARDERPVGSSAWPPPSARETSSTSTSIRLPTAATVSRG